MDEQFNINTPDTSSWNLPMGGSAVPTPTPVSNVSFSAPKAEVLDLTPQIQNLVNSVRFDAANSVTKSSPESTLNAMFPDAGKIDTTTFVPRTDTHELLNDGETWLPKYSSYQVGVNNEARLARQQTNFDRFTNIILRLGENTAKAPLDIASFVYGIGNAAVSGRFDALYDNAFSRYIDDMTTRTNFDYKNHFEENQKNLGFNMYTLDKVGSGVEFTTRMLASEAIIAGLTGGASSPTALARLGLKAGLAVDKVGDITRTGNMLSKMFRTAIKPELQVAAQGAGVVRNFERVTQGVGMAAQGGKLADRLKQLRFATTSPMYEAGFEAMHFRKEAEADFWDYYKNKGTEPTQEEIAKFSEKMDGAANSVFGANMAILSISNLAMVGDMLNVKNPLAKNLLGGWTDKVGASINKNIFKIGTEVGETSVYQAMKPTFWNKTLAYINPFIKGALTEGVYEEGSQGIASGTFKNYVASAYNKDLMNKTRDYTSAFSKAFNDQFSTREGQEELIIGSLIGGLFGGVGGVRATANEYKQQEGIAQIQNAGKEFIETFRGNAYTNEQLISLFAHGNRLQEIQAQADRAEKQGDNFTQAVKSAEAFVSLLNAYHTVGKESEFTDMWVSMMKGMDNQSISDTTGIPLDQVDSFKQEQIQNMQDFAQNYTKGRETAQYLFPRNIGGLTEVDNKGNKVKVNNQNLIDAFSYNYGMSFFNEKFALESFDAFQTNLARITTNSGLVQELGALGALRMADKKTVQEYNDLSNRLQESTSKLSELQQTLISLQKGEQNTETASNIIKIGEDIQAQQRIMEQVQNQKKLVWDSMIGNFYTKMGKQGGYASEMDLKTFAEKAKQIQNSLDNVVMNEADKTLLNKLLDQFDTANEAFKSHQAVISNLSNPKFTYKTYSGLFGGKRANLDKSMNDLTRETLKQILDSEYGVSLNKALSDYKAKPSLITDDVLQQSREDNYTPSKEILEDLNAKTKRKSELTPKEQEFYDNFKEQVDNYEVIAETEPINDTSENVNITETKIKIRLKKQQIEDLQNEVYSPELQSKIDNLNSEIDELEDKNSETIDNVTSVENKNTSEKTSWLDRVIDKIINHYTLSAQREGRELRPATLAIFENWRTTKEIDSAMFSGMLNGIYQSIRTGDYFSTNPTQILIEEITKVTSSLLKRVQAENGWHYRIPKTASTSGKGETRMSLNVRGDSRLIAILDQITSDFGIYYKTPDVTAGWDSRHDPVTIYINNENLSEAQIEELKNRVVAETAEFVRGNEGFGIYGENIAPGVEFGKEASETNAQSYIERANKISPELADAIKNYLTNKGKLKGSVGQQLAVAYLLNEIEGTSNTRLDNKEEFSTQSNAEIAQLDKEIAELEAEIKELEESGEIDQEKVKDQQEVQGYKYKQYEYTKKNGEVVVGWIEERNGKTFFVNNQESIYLGQSDVTVISSLTNVREISEEDIILEGNEVYINGKIYKSDNLDESISKDESGNYQVTLKHRNGRPAVFTGAVADAVVYQHKLNQFLEQSTNEEADELRRQAKREATIERKYEELIAKTEDKVNRQSEQEREYQAYYEQLDKLNRQIEENKRAISDKLDEIEQLKTEEQLKLENELLDLQGVLGTQERAEFFKNRIKELSQIAKPTEKETSLLNDYKIELDKLNNRKTAFDPDATYFEQLDWIVNNIKELGFESVEDLSSITPPSQEDVEEYKNLVESKSDNKRLSELREKLLPYNLAEGLEFDGMNILSIVDLYNQLKGVKTEEETQITELPIEEVFNITRQVKSDQTSASGKAANVSLNYDGVVTEFKNGKQTISHVSLTTMLSKAIRKGSEPIIKIKNDAGEITETITVTELNVEEMGEKYESKDNISVELTPDVQLEKIKGSQTFSTTGSIVDLLDARAYGITGQINTFNLVYSESSDGTWVPMEADFSVSVDGMPIMFDRETADSIKPGDTVQLEFNPNDDYNKTLRKNQFASKGNIYIRKNGKLVGVLKAEVERKAGLESWDNLVAIRKEVIESYNNKGKAIELKVSGSYLGLPQISFNSDGSAIQRNIDESKVVAYGYIDENGELQGDIKSVQIDNTQYIDPLKTVGKKVPVVAFKYAGKVYGFVVNVAPKSFGFSDEIDNIMINSAISKSEKILRLNAMLQTNNLLTPETAVTSQNFNAQEIKSRLSNIERKIDLSNQEELNQARKTILLDMNDPFLTSKLVLDLLRPVATISTTVNQNPNVTVKTVGGKGTEVANQNKCQIKRLSK